MNSASAHPCGTRNGSSWVLGWSVMGCLLHPEVSAPGAESVGRRGRVDAFADAHAEVLLAKGVTTHPSSLSSVVLGEGARRSEAASGFRQRRLPHVIQPPTARN